MKKNNDNKVVSHTKCKQYKIDFYNKIKQLKIKKIEKLKYNNEYYNVMNNFWLIDKYIAKNGRLNNDCVENSLSAAKQCVENNTPFTMIVQSLKDGQIVCIKEKVVTLNDTSSYISTYNYDQIKEYKYAGSDECICTLEQVFDTVKGKVNFVIDIFNQDNNGKMEETINSMICDYYEKYGNDNNVAIMSLNPYTLKWFYDNSPYLTRILKSGNFPSVSKFAELSCKKLQKLKYSKLAKNDFVAYYSKDLPCKFIKRTKPVGVIAYNVKDANEYQSLLKYCDNIIFDGFDPKKD